MRLGAMFLFLAAIGLVMSAMLLVAGMAQSETARDMQSIADYGLQRGEPTMLAQLLTEKQNGESYSVTTYAPTNACLNGYTCPYTMTVNYALAAGGGTATETSGQLQENAAIAEDPVYVEETATVKATTGAVLATRTRWLQATVSLVKADVTGRYDNAAAFGGALVAQGLHGCSAASEGAYQATCNADATQVGDDTSTYAELTCVDNPSLNAYCNGATPRPANTFKQVQTDNTGASSNGYAR